MYDLQYTAGQSDMEHTPSFIKGILRCVLNGSFFVDSIDTKLRIFYGLERVK